MPGALTRQEPHAQAVNLVKMRLCRCFRKLSIGAAQCLDCFSAVIESRLGTDVGNMKSRVAIWASVGALIVGLWSIYLSTGHVQPRGFLAILLDLTCPIAIARQHTMSIYTVLFANALTYAFVGLIIESIRRLMKRPLNA